MSIAKLRELQQRLFPEGDTKLLPYINSAFDRLGFSDDYINTVRSAAVRRKSKVIKDNIWGMAEFGWSSLRLIDCPILQRLRQVKQLGLSYLTYPSAEHSRFSHSLGMACVVEKLIDVSLRVQDDDFAQLKLVKLNGKSEQHLAETVRHAALLHDTGHFPFSHAVEKAYQYNAEHFYCGEHTVDEFMFIFEEVLGIPTNNHPKLSEFLTLAIILSPRFQKFYESCVLIDVAADPDRLYRIASLVVGLPPDETFPGIANLISNSAIDADKVDYIKRDSAACGIPVGIDVARLFLRSAFVEISGDDIARLFSPTDTRKSVRIFVVNSSGADTIEEIAQARASLYHRVYLHQATRGVERLLTLALINASRTDTSKDSVKEALFAWSLDDTALLRTLDALDVGTSSLSRRVRNRLLLKKACSIGRDTLEVVIRPSYLFPNQGTPYSDLEVFKYVVGEALQELTEEQLQGEAHQSLEVAIAEEATRLWQLIKGTAGKDLAPTSNEPTVTVLPIPDFNQTPPDSIINENGYLVHTPKRTSVDELGVAADIFKARGYIACEASWRELVFVAARNVLRQRTAKLRTIDVTIPQDKPEFSPKVRVISSPLVDLESGARRAGLNVAYLDRIMDAAEKAGYFDNLPTLARPPSPKSLTIEADKLKAFNGQGGWMVTPAGLAAFLHQFPPTLRAEALRMVQNIKLIDRDAIKSGILSITDSHKTEGAHGHHIVALTPNSGSFVRMIGEQELKDSLVSKNWTFQKSLDEVFGLGDSNRQLLLIDDNSVTGSQVVAQLHAWMGIARAEWPAEVRGEQNIVEAKLADRDAELFRDMFVTFGFLFAGDDALRRIEETAVKLGLKKVKAVRYQDLAKTTHSPSEELRTFLKRVGEAVLSDYWNNSSPAQDKAIIAAEATKRALGDGPGHGLLATVFNVPTSTYPALRCPGVFNGHPWVPLFIRRGYLSNLVFG